jgi:hypothetical protein
MRLDLGTLFDVLNDLIDNGDEINEYEQRNFAGLISGFREVVEMVDNAIADGIIDENGALCNSDDDSDDDDGYDPDHAYEDMRSEEIIEKIRNMVNE